MILRSDGRVLALAGAAFAGASLLARDGGGIALLPGITRAYEREIDLLSLLVLTAAAVAIALSRRAEIREEPASERGPAWAGIVGMPLCVLGAALVIRRPDGPAEESVVPPLVVAAFAMASWFSPRGALWGRGIVQTLTLLAWVLSTRSAACAAIATVLLALLAGEGVASASGSARRAAALALIGLLALACYGRAPAISAPGRVEVDPDDELVRWPERPPARLTRGPIPFRVEVDPAVRFDGLLARIERLDDSGRVVEGERLLLRIDHGRPEGPGLATRQLPDGAWRFSLDVVRKDAAGVEQVIGTRVGAVSVLERRPRLTWTLALSALATLVVLLFATGKKAGAWIAVALAAAQACLLRGT